MVPRGDDAGALSNTHDDDKRDAKRSSSIVQWPHTFQTEEEYSEELDEAIQQDPRFGEWLRKYRNINHIYRSINGYPSIGLKAAFDLFFDDNKGNMWDLSVDDLKMRYIEERTRKERAQHAKRKFARMHVENYDEYETAKQDHMEAIAAFEVATKEYARARAHQYDVYLTHGPPKPPPKPQAMIVYEKLTEFLDEGHVDKSSVTDSP